MGLLERIETPADVKGLSRKELDLLAGEIREFLIDKVRCTGGHLGPNLGIVELTLALHRVFNSPRDRIVWDTGYQSYVHKIVTGRRDEFDRLRQQGGLSGYPSRAESSHDLVENSHASTALSYADGLAKGLRLRGITDQAVVAVVGDGALTGGMAWEALNNISASDRPVIIVVNDNGRSYAPTVGGLAARLGALRTSPRYERALGWTKRMLRPMPLVYGALHALKSGLKDMVAPQALFQDLGLKYVGPIDGHDVGAVESALRQAVRYGGPVIVHCLTTKGRGFREAELDHVDHHHAIGPTTTSTGTPATSWTSVFSSELVEIGRERPEVVAVTAAMLEPAGLAPFARQFPGRVFDVGIAEQHAVTSAAGLAMAGLRPIVSIYSTFLNRAFDQVLLDVAMHSCPVVFVLDRAGVTGDDGASHNGMWDLPLLHIVPSLRIAAPRDEATLRAALREAVDHSDGPSAVRYPKGPVGPPVAAIERLDGPHLLYGLEAEDILLVTFGPLAGLGLDVAELLAHNGISATVVDPVWVKPVNPSLVKIAEQYRLVVTVEDGLRTGGCGTALAQALSDAAVPTPVLTVGLPQRFLDHGKRAQVLAECGLTAPELARSIADRLLALNNLPTGELARQ